MTRLQQILSVSGKWVAFPGKVIKVLRKHFGCFAADPRFYWMRILARFQIVRNSITQGNICFSDGHTIAISPSKDLSIQSPFPVLCQILKEEGYYQGLQLSPAMLSAFLQFAETMPCYANRDPQLPFLIHERDALATKLDKPIVLASYLNTHESFPAFEALKTNALVLAIASAYLGCEPQYQRGELAWSFPITSTDAEKMAAAQVFHCDINDYRTIKFFFYLSQVDWECGPHAYLKGSHRTRKWHHQLLGQRCAAIADEALIETYGSDAVTTVYGPAGFGFVGDPYAFHKGTAPTRHPRLLMQLEFGINTYKTWYFNTPSIETRPESLTCSARI